MIQEKLIGIIIDKDHHIIINTSEIDNIHLNIGENFDASDLIMGIEKNHIEGKLEFRWNGVELKNDDRNAIWSKIIKLMADGKIPKLITKINHNTIYNYDRTNHKYKIMTTIVISDK